MCTHHYSSSLFSSQQIKSTFVMKEQNGLLGTHELQTNYIPSCKIIYPPVNHYSHGKSPSFLIHTIKLVENFQPGKSVELGYLEPQPKKVFLERLFDADGFFFCQLSIATYIQPPSKKIEFDGRTEVFTGGPSSGFHDFQAWRR